MATDSSSGTSDAGPVSTGAPSVSGTTAVGRRLTALTGTWAGSGTIGYAFQWYRCDANGARCNSVHGATSATYVLVPKDVAKTIGLTVNATDTTGAASAYASLVGPIARPTPLLVSTAQPQINGPPIQGKTVQVTTGAWSPTPAKITYAWLRCNRNGRVCGRIADATGNSYTIAGADVDHALVALVQASFGTTAQSALSTATPSVVAANVIGPTRVAGPAVGGIAAQGRQLTAAAGTWSGLGPLSYAYRWYRCDATGAHCNPVRGATGATYTLVARDAGRTLALTVHATDSTGTATAYASLAGPIAPASAMLNATSQPTIAGDGRIGQTLVVSPGRWAPAPSSYSYAWQRCNPNGRICAAIAGANGSSYVVAAADAGHGVAAVVTATSGTAGQAAFSTLVSIR